MFVQRFGKGGAIVMMPALQALPVRYLSLIALAVLAVWAWFARSAGREFDDLTARPAS